MEIPRWNSVIQFKRCVRNTVFLWKVQEGALSLNSKGVPGVRSSFLRSWRVQEGTLSSSWNFAKPIWHSYIFVRVCFLIYDIIEYVYHSTCDKKFSVQLDPYLVQRRKYNFRIYVSKLIITQSSSPYKVVFVSTSMVIVIFSYY